MSTPDQGHRPQITPTSVLIERRDGKLDGLIRIGDTTFDAHALIGTLAWLTRDSVDLNAIADAVQNPEIRAIVHIGRDPALQLLDARVIELHGVVIR